MSGRSLAWSAVEEDIRERLMTNALLHDQPNSDEGIVHS
ncbi:hypothetical protein OROHE_026657 [Orobanche hederae]